MVPAFALAVRSVSLPRLLGFIGGRPAAAAGDTRGTIDAMVRSVERAAVHSPLPGACLPRSLTLMYVLARRGIATELRLGARIAGTGFEAHAWVEHDGIALNDPANLRAGYAVLTQKQTAA